MLQSFCWRRGFIRAEPLRWPIEVVLVSELVIGEIVTKAVEQAHAPVRGRALQTAHSPS
jgi:hypothetical protein